MNRHLVLFVPSAILALLELTTSCATVDDFANDEDGGSSADAGDVSDARLQVRESSVTRPETSVPTTPLDQTFPCDGGLGPDQTCNNMEGKGCCLTGAVSTCMEQSAASSCTGAFVACRQGDNDNPCCWLDLGGGKRIARHVGDCDGGPTACIDDGGCPENVPCTTATCADGFVIGQCGQTAPVCP